MRCLQDYRGQVFDDTKEVIIQTQRWGALSDSTAHVISESELDFLYPRDDHVMEL